MIMPILLALLGALALAVGWVAWETRRVHQALHVYAAAVQQWHALLQHVERQRQEDPP